MNSYQPRLGAVVTARGVSFRVWAPAQKELALVLEGRDDIPMQAEAGGYFSTQVADARAGERYRYRLKQGLRADPVSRFQPDGPLGPSEIVDPRSFRWSDATWPGAPERHRHVLYELHIGTFTPEGTWRSAERHLADLKDIGITTIEVMPIAEFAGDFGWGYDGVHFFSPTRLYGSPDDARHFVDAAHAMGLAVILDVVYNHFGPVGNFISEFSDTFLGAPGEWGDSINFDGPGSEGVRAFVAENAAYWVAEYHFDGLRLDAVDAIHDGSAEHMVSELARSARGAAGHRRIFLSAESEAQQAPLLRDYGRHPDGVDAIWNEDWHHVAYVALRGRRQAYFTDYQGTAAEMASIARHGFLYQGQWYSWQKHGRGGFALDQGSACFVNFLENHDQVANTGPGWRLYHQVSPAEWRALTALLLLGPGLPLLFQGVEFASSKPFAYFAHHEGDLGEAVRKGRAEFLSQFPGLGTAAATARIPVPSSEETFAGAKLRHEERHEHRWAVDLHRDLLSLRRDDEVIGKVGTSDVRIETSAPDPNIVLLRYMTTTDDRLIVINFGDDYHCPMNDPLYACRPNRKWVLAWSSEDPRYGGDGVVPLCDGPWLIAGRSAMLLRDEAGS